MNKQLLISEQAGMAWRVDHPNGKRYGFTSFSEVQDHIYEFFIGKDSENVDQTTKNRENVDQLINNAKIKK